MSITHRTTDRRSTWICRALLDRSPNVRPLAAGSRDHFHILSPIPASFRRPTCRYHHQSTRLVKALTSIHVAPIFVAVFVGSTMKPPLRVNRRFAGEWHRLAARKMFRDY
ncbi:hypothetical protein Salat_0595200 [Sesamum alatum]|uniref:Uncharacterized protein n=1 Tax=Sesamum alatum TaxID=300844 RepID=A0AAE1YPR5_9LAMI|nr:hypothetical protein Salat_0595200 [Sesamum alatum]